MDRNKVAELASKMQTKDDLLSLLNVIKREEASDMGHDVSTFHPFTMKQLNYYCNPNHERHRYRQFRIKKKSGGFRQITTPYNRTFMMLLQAMNEILKAIYYPSEYAMGFVQGRSVVTNAAVHKGQNYIFNIDLKDFFPSVEQGRVWKRLQVKPYCIPAPIANLIAGLCAMKMPREHILESAKHYLDKNFIYVLPQGAPTSPVLTNMVCDRLDYCLGGLAKRFGLRYTRYADDITFSSMHYVYAKNGDFLTELKRIIKEQGFTINDGKTRLEKKGAKKRQEVTGVVVSEKLNVTQKYMREVRTLLHIWKKYGYDDAYSRFLPKYKSDKGHVKKGNPDMINVIDGKLLYMKMVKGESDPVYIKLHERFQELVNTTFNRENTNSKGTTFIKTYKLLDFEKEKSYSPVTIFYREKDKPYAIFESGGVKQNVSIDSKLKKEDIEYKEKLAISLCRGADQKTFWLIHRQNKYNVPPQKDVDIDTLITLLKSLLNT